MQSNKLPERECHNRIRSTKGNKSIEPIARSPRRNTEQKSTYRAHPKSSSEPGSQVPRGISPFRGERPPKPAPGGTRGVMRERPGRPGLAWGPGLRRVAPQDTRQVGLGPSVGVQRGYPSSKLPRREGRGGFINGLNLINLTEP